MKNRLIIATLVGLFTVAGWADFTWPTEDAEIHLNNKAISTFYKDGTTWAHRADVAQALDLPTEGEDMVDLQKVFAEKGVTVRVRQSGVIDAVMPRASVRGAAASTGSNRRSRGYSGGSYYPASSSSVKSKTASGGHTKNYTPYKDQREEYLNTHTTNGRIFNLNQGEYKSGQENRVYVDGYTTKNGTTVNPVTRKYPGSSRNRNNGIYNGGNSGGQGIPGSPNPNW